MTFDEKAKKKIIRIIRDVKARYKEKLYLCRVVGRYFSIDSVTLF